MKFLRKISGLQIVNREELLTKYCNGKSVLHLGFVDEGLIADKIISNDWLHAKLHPLCKELWGVDIDEAGIRMARSAGYDNLLYGNVEEPKSINIGKRFDVILAADIIEHLSNVSGLLETIRLNKHENGVGIISTPNAMRYYNTILALFGYELIHPTHTMWLSVATIQYLLKSRGFEILEFYMFHNTRKFKPISSDSFLRILMKIPLYFFDLLASKTLIRACPLISDGIIVVFR